ncbi:hypothetical protein D1614_09280 [Maribellus luteus]|uniref:DUF420 domain-containing protein n=1 Tax=Maribellus luteus TaxID=2305463 RepID=A0A399T4A5_9BACT|nr:hypothetical protein [Maribellus luteus]RIJ48713.1 hypothetical protein D1614_09280 [Maribellus luteus]
MSTLLRIGTIVVLFAFLAYSLGIYREHRKRLLTKSILFFITLGVVLDITATVYMILGSSEGAFTLHGILGYLALAGMFTDAVLLWRIRIKEGLYNRIPKKIHLYSRYAYLWWVLAFITGGLLVMLG